MTDGAQRRAPGAAAGRDPVGRARELHQVYDPVPPGAPRPAPRSLASESWQPSLAARVDPDGHAPPVTYSGDGLSGVRAAHPLGAVLALLRSPMVSIAEKAVHVIVVTDAADAILWWEAARSLLRAADSVGLSPGMRWS